MDYRENREAISDKAVEGGHFTRDQVNLIEDMIDADPTVSLLMDKVVTLMQMVEDLQSARLEDAKTAQPKASTQRLDLGLPLNLYPSVNIQYAKTAALAYIAATGNVGEAARQRVGGSGEIIVDLGHPDILPLLPQGAKPTNIYRSCKASRTRAHRRVKGLDREYMGWSRIPPLALVLTAV